MELLRATLLGLVIAIALPMTLGGPTGAWTKSFAAWGTIAPLETSPGLLVSIPLFVGATVLSWIFFNWYNR